MRIAIWRVGIVLASIVLGLAHQGHGQELFFEDFERFANTRDFTYQDFPGEDLDHWTFNDEPGAPDLAAVTPNRLTGQSATLDGANPWVLSDDAPPQSSGFQTGTLSPGARQIQVLGNTTIYLHSGGGERYLGGGQDYDNSDGRFHGLRTFRQVDYSPLESAEMLVVEHMQFLTDDFRNAEVFVKDHRQLGFSPVQEPIVSGEQNNVWTFYDANGVATEQASNLSFRGFQWVAVRAEYDLTANDGSGSASLFTKLHDDDGNLLDTEWQPVPEMQDLPVNMSDPWTDLTHVHLSMNSNVYNRQLIDDIRLTAIPAAGGLNGDFNEDGIVDGIDYALWRENLDSATPLPNDDGLGAPVGSSHFDLWRANYGAQANPGASLGGSVAAPEPATALTALCAFGGALAIRRRARFFAGV